MFLQTDDRLNPISAWGCYFMSILALSEKVSGEEFDVKRVLELWFINWQERDIDIESAVLDPQGLLDDLPGDLEFLGWRDAEYKLQEGEFGILKYFNPRTEFEHFVLGDHEGKVEWDPRGNSVTVREGYVVNKRVFRVRGTG